VSNTGTVDAQVAVLYIDEPGTPWMRINFDQVELAGNPKLGTGSYLKITSLKDGYYQYLNAETMVQWDNQSAYFNGGSLQVELFASPGTGANRLVVDGLTLGALPPVIIESQCGASDDRLPSNDPRAARILPIGCTGFIINDACGCFLTAGHCTSGTRTVQFNVPPSNANGSLNNPPPSDQYTVDTGSIQSNGGQGIGNDWGYFGVFPNSTTGQSPRAVQGSYTLATPPPAYDPSKRVRITGFGVDGGTRNQTQQTHVGPWLNYNGGTQLDYMTDTEGGNSGSPVIQEEAGMAMGIHTHGGCSASSGNHGTASVHSGLQAALANPMGVCKKLTPPSCPTIPSTSVDNGTGANPLCLTSVTPPALGTNWDLTVDTSVVAGGNFAGIRLQAAGAPVQIELGELLLDLSKPILLTQTNNGSGTQAFSIALPVSVNLAGFTASAQGFVGVNGKIRQLCNAVQFTLGCVQ